MPEKAIIRRIRIYRFPVKLKVPFIISLGKLEFADNVIVVIESAGGLKGFGECSPFQTIHGENSSTCVSVGKVIGEKLIGEDALNISGCLARMDATIFGNSSIKSAFDMALYDIASQHARMPLYRFLGGSNDKEIFTDYTVSIGPAEKMADDAEWILKAGFSVIKVKLGGTEEEDVLRIQKIRERVGNTIPLRIDANQGWDVETAIRILNKLHPYNIQHCEEPVSRKKFMSLAEIRQKTLIPIMADESCFDEFDAERLIALNACDLINVKLGKSSGIFKAQKISTLALHAGIKLQAGGFLESRLGFTAIAHLVLSNNQFIHFDFDTPLMFTEDLVTGGITYLEKGRIKIPDVNGLGATISEDVLKSKEVSMLE